MGSRGEEQDVFSALGLLDKGSIVMTNTQNRIILSFRSSSSIGDVDIIRNNKLKGMLDGETGILHIEEYGEKKAVFFSRNVGSRCNLLYVINEEFLAGDVGKSGMLIIAAACLFLVIGTIVLVLFRRNIYLPIVNMEKTLDDIVSEEKNITVHTVQRNNELYPLYSNLNLLTYRLKKLIDSEYTANVRKKQAEIDALQSQINPHFLYNTLESIRGQALEEGQKSIANMVKALSDIFRYSISKKSAMVTLKEELRNIDNYLNIQQYRFDNRFIIHKAIEEETLGCMVPKLIVQPLVENAIVHGLETKEGQGTIDIIAYLVGDDLVISVKDDGEGIDNEKLAYINECLANGVPIKDYDDVRTGLALININERIHMIFDNNHGLRLYSMKNIGTNAELWIPRIIE